MKIRNVTLEMSLKPFRRLDDEYVEATCREMFRQWRALTDRADVVSVLLWAADGSEIFEYRSRDNDKIEWARYIGGANPKKPIPNDPDCRALHSRSYLYMENPPVITYGDLRKIIAAIKRVGRDVTGKPIRVGETFDPGPEFARSPFKYERHPEICQADTMGSDQHRFVTCYTHLHADDRSYAGFPDGIAEGTSLGTFLGRQSRLFLADMGFDYLWLSNGFGFGRETWGTTGDLFDGENFYPGKSREIAEKIKEFWRTFRAECAELPIETRGTNLSLGIDIASDATPYAWLNEANLNFSPPPNSPWAAMDGNFGLELAGYMSHIAELPGDQCDFPFRFYTHDPWWLNSPWLDRYQRQPHDIYMPLSVSRIDADGRIQNPASIAFLTVDDSYGRMPAKVPNEVIPHILTAVDDAPDAPGPLVWVYPFDEYHDMAFGEQPRLEEPFFGDWFMIGAINQGLPVNTVVSSRNFLKTLQSRPEIYGESVLVVSLPAEGTPMAAAIKAFVRGGGKVLCYGPSRRADRELLKMLNVRRESPIEGELTISLHGQRNKIDHLPAMTKLNHRVNISAGSYETGIDDCGDEYTCPLADVSFGGELRVAALSRALPQWQGGRLGWVRGTVSACWKGGLLLTADDATEYFRGETLMRLAMKDFGYDIAAGKTSVDQRTPMICVARHGGGFFFSGYTPNTNVALRLRFPQGVPLLTGMDVNLRGGTGEYRMPRAWHAECRCFVDQADDGELFCSEVFSGEVGVAGRILIRGLKNATLRYYGEPGSKADVTFRRPDMLYRDDLIIPHETVQHAPHTYAVVRNISGDVMISAKAEAK
ncbi:MAG: hypothetical protein K8S55_06500 [Phycisphaerae bacterium]|nr:hypothetical protein [Phycisphaerae bacterium]